MSKKIRKTRKKLREDISVALASSLSKLLDGMNEKKFNRSIKKASKVLIADFDITKANMVQHERASEVA